MIVKNINRIEANNFSENLDPEKWAWITIQEPNIENSVVKNNILNTLSTLRLEFWDIEYPIPDILNKENMLYPPSDIIAEQIVDFLRKQTLLRRNILVNCLMGKSRSGAIAKFCHQYMAFEWESQGRHRTENHGYNECLFDKMVEYYKKVKNSSIVID